MFLFVDRCLVCTVLSGLVCQAGLTVATRFPLPVRLLEAPVCVRLADVVSCPWLVSALIGVTWSLLSSSHFFFYFLPSCVVSVLAVFIVIPGVFV